METETIEPHSMRIASHGKISALVKFALNFLKENPTRAIVLHTLPYKQCDEQHTGKSSSKKRKIGSSTNDVPRLISVVEIIKREFKEGGLYQYNELGSLDTPGTRQGRVEVPTEPGEERQAAVLEALQGKNHVPIQRTPYMKITLCRVALPEASMAGATYQAPMVKKISRSAKARKRKQAKKGDKLEGNEEAGDEDAMEVIPN
ncbi:hypothetical protein RhiJN_02724 [Ceratobasidium sp. AG-Ba]|nr:hypothetical protein RhiJN_02724 [Ceratobasidium sp. AG-Ba]